MNRTFRIHCTNADLFFFKDFTVAVDNIETSGIVEGVKGIAYSKVHTYL